jgi:methionyl-tRNA synthetase
MSKSRGGAISPREVVELVRSDGLRYFFAREVPLGLDGTISLEAIVNRYNYDLGNDLGNLLNRLLTMTEKYFGGVVPETPEYRESDTELQELAARQRDEALKLMERYELSRALEETFTIIRECNRFIDSRKPWVLGKKPDRAEEFTGAFCVLFDAVRTAAILLAPVMPAAMQKLWEQLGLAGRVADTTFADAGKPYPRGNRIGRAEPLFPRIDLNEETPAPAAPEESAGPEAREENHMAENMIEFGDFQKVEIIVAKILSAEPVAGADKLIKMQMDDGRGGRQTVAGIAPWIKPEDLVGLHVPIIANLKPAKLRGELSEGMLLAAQDDAGNLSLVVMQEEIAPGSKVV